MINIIVHACVSACDCYAEMHSQHDWYYRHLLRLNELVQRQFVFTLHSLDGDSDFIIKYFEIFYTAMRFTLFCLGFIVIWLSHLAVPRFVYFSLCFCRTAHFFSLYRSMLFFRSAVFVLMLLLCGAWLLLLWLFTKTDSNRIQSENQLLPKPKSIFLVAFEKCAKLLISPNGNGTNTKYAS